MRTRGFFPKKKKRIREQKSLGDTALRVLGTPETVVCAEVRNANHTPMVTGESANASQGCTTRSDVLSRTLTAAGT